MLRTLLAVGSMGAAIAIFSCSAGNLGGGPNDAGPDDCVGGRIIPPTCYRACDGSSALPSGSGCPAGYVYTPSYCAYGVDGSGLVSNTCGDDGGADGPTDASPDACTGTMIWESCYRICDGASALPDGGTCPPGFDYSPSVCFHGAVDGHGPVTNTCGVDAAGGSGGAGGHAVGGAGGATMAGSCVAGLSLDGAAIAPVHYHSGERPAADIGVGGVIADGVYDLNSSDIYRSSDSEPPSTSMAVIRISNGGTRLEYVSGNWGDAGVAVIDVAFGRTLATSGTQVTETETCRDGGGLQPAAVEDYSATSTRFMLSNPLYVKRFVKR